jgi:hypothetical protein
MPRRATWKEVLGERDAAITAIPANGDCFYLCLEMAMRTERKGAVAGDKEAVRAAVQAMRQRVAAAVDGDTLDAYRAAAAAGMSEWEWIDDVEHVDDLKTRLLVCGLDAGNRKCVWADEVAISVMCKTMGLTILVVDSAASDSAGTPTCVTWPPAVDGASLSKHFILLHHTRSGNHYNLIRIAEKAVFRLQELSVNIVSKFGLSTQAAASEQEHTQADDPAPERLPATQAEHVSENAREYVPARQVVQELAPALEREPASHVTQAVASCLEHLPTLHTEHVSTDEAPVATECVPAVQLLVHAVTPGSVENFPAAQSTQTTTDEAPWTVGGGRDSRLGSQPRRSRVARFAVEDKKKGVVVPKALKALEKILAARAAALEATRSAEAARFVESGVIFSAALAKVAPPQPPPQPPPRPQPQPQPQPHTYV